MIVRSMLVTALLVAAPSAALAQEKDDAIATPVLRAQVTVESDIVRIGDMIENAGTAAQIAIYRSPDLGTTGTLPTAQIINTLQAHQVIGVDTRDIKSVVHHAAGAHRRRQGDRIPGRARDRTSQRPWRCRQSQPDIRPRRAGPPAGGMEQRRAAARAGALRAAQRALRRLLRDRQRHQQHPHQAALHRRCHRDAGCRGSDPQRRARRRAEGVRRRDRAASEGRSGQRRRAPRPRRRHADAQGRFAPARRCGWPISASPTWCSATTMSR